MSVISVLAFYGVRKAISICSGEVPVSMVATEVLMLYSLAPVVIKVWPMVSEEKAPTTCSPAATPSETGVVSV